MSQNRILMASFGEFFGLARDIPLGSPNVGKIKLMQFEHLHASASVIS